MRRWFVLPMLTMFTAAHAAPALSIAVTDDMAHCIEALDAAFIAEHPDTTIELTAGNDAALAAKAAGGAFDVFVASDVETPRRLAQSGHAVLATLKPYGVGRLALWTNTPGINPGRGRTVLTAASTMKIALLDASSAYGRAATAAMARIGVAEAVQGKLVPDADLGATMRRVQSGEAEVGFVPYSLLLAPPLQGVGIYILVPGGAYEPPLQAAIVTQHGADNALAKAYVSFLGSAKARQILEDNGYEAPLGSGPTRRTN